MSHRELQMMLISATLGFLGGNLNLFRMRSAAADQSVVRATRFELTDESGRVRAFWGQDANKDEGISFLDENKRTIAVLGARSLGASVSPFLDMAGKDGKSRITLQLGFMDRPILAMSDEKWEGRVMLGFVQSDAPDPIDADWALRFQYPNRALIGVTRDPRNGSLTGALFLSDSKKELLRLPK